MYIDTEGSLSPTRMMVMAKGLRRMLSSAQQRTKATGSTIGIIELIYFIKYHRFNFLDNKLSYSLSFDYIKWSIWISVW